MSKNVNKKKFYRPGTLEVKGTKISLKTQPYTNGVIFDVNDPITSFHAYLSAMKIIVEEYEILRAIPGMELIDTGLDLQSGITGKIKLLIDFLAQSPIEINLKEQQLDNNVLAELELTHHEGE